jgi:PAS domain S-box-containing protein
MPTLEQTIALLEATLESIHDGILVVDLDRHIVQFNQRFLKMFRFSAEQASGCSIDSIATLLSGEIEDGELFVGSSPTPAADEAADTVDLIRFKDGRAYQSVRAAQVLNGKIAGYVTTYRDVSDAARMTRELAQERAFLEKAQEVAHVGSWVAELTGIPSLTWSAETYRIFGVPLSKVPNSFDDFGQYIHPDDRDAVTRAAEAARSGAVPYDVEHRILRRDGDVRWVHEKADVVWAADGTPLRMIGTVQDITERRHLEEQLRQAQKLEAIGRLAGGVAHDLNNALTAIVGYTELALGALLPDDPARPDVQEIKRGAERAESVTRQLLAFSRKQLLEPRVFYASESIAMLGRMLERLLGAGITLKTIATPSLPPIYGDPGQIEQALINLAVNARDAMPDGGQLTLQVARAQVDEAFARAHQPMAAGEYVEISVSDSGHGMSPEIQAHIFEPFFTTKGVGKGTGLGLAMVYGTVKQSGGYIFVESDEGRGTTFRLYFPPARLKETQPAAAPPDTADAGEVTILVTEDEPAVRTLVVSALKSEGYRVLFAASGDEALAVAAKASGRIHLLLTDANMPGMTGVELAAALAPMRPGLKVVVMSGYTSESLSVPGLDECVALLPKPFTPRDLKQKVRDVLGSEQPMPDGRP